MVKGQQIIFEYWQNQCHALNKKDFSKVMGDLQIEEKRIMEVD